MLVVETNELVQVLIPLVEVLDDLQISYYIGGSVVSNVYGELRSTFDVDVIADIQLKHVLSLVRRLKSEYYIDADMIRDAIRHKSSFNIIYLASMFKDVHLYRQDSKLRRTIRMACLHHPDRILVPDACNICRCCGIIRRRQSVHIFERAQYIVV